MSFSCDVEDWLGGLPCEFADVEAVRAFVSSRDSALARVQRQAPGANDELPLRRAG